MCYISFSEDIKGDETRFFEHSRNQDLGHFSLGVFVSTLVPHV